MRTGHALYAFHASCLRGRGLFLEGAVDAARLVQLLERYLEAARFHERPRVHRLRLVYARLVRDQVLRRALFDSLVVRRVLAWSRTSLGLAQQEVLRFLANREMFIVRVELADGLIVAGARSFRLAIN